MKRYSVRALIAMLGTCLLAAVICVVIAQSNSVVRSHVIYNQPSGEVALERISDTRPPLAAPCAHSCAGTETLIFNSEMVSQSAYTPAD